MPVLCARKQHYHCLTLRHSGKYVYHLLPLTESVFLARYICVSRVKATAIAAPNNINVLVFVMETQHVCCEVGTELVQVT